MKKLKQVTGDVEKFEKTTLDQILGLKGDVLYGTMDKTEYEIRLKSLNKTDLQLHAAKCGIVPIDDRQRLERNLIRKFQEHVASFQKPKSPNIKNKKVSKNVLDILSQGR